MSTTDPIEALEISHHPQVRRVKAAIELQPTRGRAANIDNTIFGPASSDISSGGPCSCVPGGSMACHRAPTCPQPEVSFMLPLVLPLPL
eukprot:2893351-Pyramimonas_sp.AAC.1